MRGSVTGHWRGTRRRRYTDGVRVLSTLVLALLLLVPSLATAGLLAVERHQLDNGLDVIIHVDRRLPLLALNLSYHVGSMHDGAHPGLAHVVEHLMFRGTRHLTDGEGDRLLAEAGAVGTNAATMYDHTSYHTLIPSEALPLALWIEADRMAHLRAALSDRIVREEIQTVVDEWEFRVQSQRHGLDRDALWATLFPADHPFHPVGPKQVRRLRRTLVLDQVKRYHGPANATLVLAGDVPADALEQVERYFGHRRGGERPPAPTSLTVDPREERRVDREAELSATPTVAMAWPSAGLYEPGDAEADVLMATLDAGVLRDLVEAELPDALLGIESAQLSRRGQSLFIIAAEGTTTTTPEQLLAAIDTALETLRGRPLTEAEIERATKRFTTDMLRGLQRIDDRAQQIQHYVAAGKDPDWLEQDLARYEAVSASSVARFVETTLAPERRVVVVSRPKGTAR